MPLTRPLRLLLFAGGAIALAIGAALLLFPVEFHAGHGIELAPSPSLLSEVRSPGGALLLLGGLMTLGAFRSEFTLAATATAAAVYLGYGTSRLLSLGLDGVPAPGLVGAAVLELLLGAACAVALARGVRRPAVGGHR